MKQQKRYQLAVRYEIQSRTVDIDDDGREVGGYGYNGERLIIEDTFDLATAMKLTEVLAKIDQIHDVIKPT